MNKLENMIACKINLDGREGDFYECFEVAALTVEIGGWYEVDGYDEYDVNYFIPTDAHVGITLFSTYNENGEDVVIDCDEHEIARYLEKEALKW